MRIILRDTKDEIIENIEDYVEIPEPSDGESNFEIAEDYDTRAKEGNCSVTKDEFKTIFASYPKIVQHADAFYEMQEKYNVSAVFAAAVSIQEQSGGNASTSHVANNNWFSMKKSGDYSYLAGDNSIWAGFNSVENAINAFGNNIANGSYYYTKGKYTLSQIGPTYCEGNAWAGHVSAHMVKALKKLENKKE